MAATAGPWTNEAQHAGPPSGLLVRAIEACQPEPGQRLARLSVDILRPVPVAPVTVRSRVLRPGRRITLIEAVLTADGTEILVGRGWRIAKSEGAPPPAVDPVFAVPPLPPEETPLGWPGAHESGYLSAVEWRVADGSFPEPGPARVWARPKIPLVQGETTSPTARTLILADSGSGVSAALPAGRVVLDEHRPHRGLLPAAGGEAGALDAETSTDPGGTGLARTTLADQAGPFGLAAQTLVGVAPVSEPLDAVVVGAGPNGLAAALTLAGGWPRGAGARGGVPQAGGGTRTEGPDPAGVPPRRLLGGPTPWVARPPLFRPVSRGGRRPHAS